MPSSDLRESLISDEPVHQFNHHSIHSFELDSTNDKSLSHPAQSNDKHHFDGISTNQSADYIAAESMDQPLITSTEQSINRSSDRQPTPLPRGQIMILSMVLYSTTFPQNVLFAFLPFMIEWLVPSLDRTSLGYRAGVVAAAFQVGLFVSSYSFGLISDRIGRRICLIIGLITSLITSLMFGLSTSFEMAVLSRFLAGALCGNNALVKTMMSEITDDTNSAKAFALVGGMDGLARLTAPGLGGLLSMPKQNLGLDFWLTNEYPFFIPCAISAIVNLFTTIACFIWLKETLPDSIKQSNERRKRRKAGGISYQVTALDLEDDHRRAEGSISQLIKHRPIIICVSLNACLMILAVAINEGLPLWVVNSIDNYGFDMTSSQIGLIFTILGPMQTICQLLIFPRFVKRVGYVDTLKYCLIMVGVFSMIMPNVYYLNDSTIAVWIGLLSVFIALVMHRSSAFTTIFALVSNVCTNEQKAAANGVSMSFAALAGVIGPVVGGSVLAWSIERENPSYPLDFSALWVLMAFLSWMAALLAHQLPESANRKLTKEAVLASRAHSSSTSTSTDQTQSADVERV